MSARGICVVMPGHHYPVFKLPMLCNLVYVFLSLVSKCPWITWKPRLSDSGSLGRQSRCKIWDWLLTGSPSIFFNMKRDYIPDASGMLLQLLPGPCVSWGRVQLSGPSMSVFSSCGGCIPWIHMFVDWTLSYVCSKSVIFDRNNAREDMFILTHGIGAEFSQSIMRGWQDSRERLYQTLPTHVDRKQSRTMNN